MSAGAITQMAERISDLLEERLHVGGRDLDARLRRAGRRLPARIRTEARLLAEAAGQSANPKIAKQLDMDRITAAYDACSRHLQGLGRAERRRGRMLDLLGSVAFNLLVLAAAIIGFLIWRGFL